MQLLQAVVAVAVEALKCSLVGAVQFQQQLYEVFTCSSDQDADKASAPQFLVGTLSCTLTGLDRLLLCAAGC